MKPNPEWAGSPAPNPSELSVFEYMGKLVVDSRKVAPFVEKDHAHLLRDIRRYVKVMDESLNPKLVSVDYFFPATYIDPTERLLPNFFCTEKGCAMIANKMTGDRGILFTALFVEAFYEMRERLRNQSAWDQPEEDDMPELYGAEREDYGMGAYLSGRKETEAQKLAARRAVQLADERHRARLRKLCQR